MNFFSNKKIEIGNFTQQKNILELYNFEIQRLDNGGTSKFLKKKLDLNLKKQCFL